MQLSERDEINARLIGVTKKARGPAEKGKGAARPPGSAEGALRPLPCARPAPARGRTRPARARRPVLPRTGSAVLWAMAGLAAEFGMGIGADPASVAALAQGAPCASGAPPGALAAA